MLTNARSTLLQALEWMLDLTMSHSAGGDYESAIGDGIGDVLILFGGGENVSCADCRNRIAKGRAVGIDYAQVSEAEVAHGAGSCADVEGIAGGDQDYAEAVEFGGEWQGNILS